MSALPCIDPLEVLGRLYWAEGDDLALAPTPERGSQIDLSQRHGDTKVFSFFSVPLCLRERIFSSRSHAPAWECRLAAPAARDVKRRRSVGTCSHAGAWEPDRRIAGALAAIRNIQICTARQRQQLILVKSALMQDLLTGKVRVTPLLEAGA